LGFPGRGLFPILSPIVLFVFLETLVAAQALTAYRDHLFTVAQMQQRGTGEGLPFVWHFGLWGDIFIISPLAAHVAGRYFLRWLRDYRSLISIATGCALASLLSWAYTHSNILSVHIQNHELTAAGELHLGYMALTLAIFTQFLFFTKHDSIGLLRTTSVLLLIQVFIGTHMVLGILDLNYPLGWYLDRPLKSLFGWAIVCATAIVLAWQNFGKKLFVDLPLDLLEFFTGIDPRSDEGYLKFLSFTCSLTLATTYFFELLETEWQKGKSWAALLLLFVIATKYALSRISVKQELAIGKSLYPPDRLPDSLKLEDRAKITSQVVLFMVLYMVLGFVADYIIVASAILTAIACGDLLTRFLLRKKVDATFSDVRYSPLESDRDYQTIVRRRYVAKWYLDGLPHLKKEMLVIAGCAIAFGLSAYGYAHNLNLDFAAYAVLIATQVLNEVVTVWWRVDRFLRLKPLESPS
jgi:hypothetical protein